MFFYWQGFGESWKTSKACFLRNIQLPNIQRFRRKPDIQRSCMFGSCMSGFLRKRCMSGFLPLSVNKALLYLQAYISTKLKY
jgi:hypothetical protein